MVDFPQDHYEANKGQVLGLEFHDIAKRSDRVIGLSMLTLIYRSIAPEKPSGTAFCRECIDAARDTLREHDRCVAVITEARGKTVYLEAYINWSVTDNPPSPSLISGDTISETGSDTEMQVHHPLSLHPLHHPLLPHHRDVLGLGPRAHETSSRDARVGVEHPLAEDM